MYPISTAVNNVRNQGPQLLEPVEEPEETGAGRLTAVREAVDDVRAR